MIIGFDKFLTKEAYKYILFGFINGQRAGACFFCGKQKMTVDQALQNFMKFHNLTDDNFNIDSARVEYYRMNKDYIETQKNG
jgi:hypothetical protein